MASPFEHAWMLLKNEGEMPFQNNFGQDPPGMTEQSLSLSDYEPTPIPPELQYKKPSNLVSPTGRLGDIPLDERGIREMSLPKRPKGVSHSLESTKHSGDEHMANMKSYNPQQ